MIVCRRYTAWRRERCHEQRPAPTWMFRLLAHTPSSPCTSSNTGWSEMRSGPLSLYRFIYILFTFFFFLQNQVILLTLRITLVFLFFHAVCNARHCLRGVWRVHACIHVYVCLHPCMDWICMCMHTLCVHIMYMVSAHTHIYISVCVHACAYLSSFLCVNSGVGVGVGGICERCSHAVIYDGSLFAVFTACLFNFVPSSLPLSIQIIWQFSILHVVSCGA